MEPSTTIALLIDAENASAKAVEFVLSDVARHGVAHVRRAYGNWKSPSLSPWEEQLHARAIRPVQQFAYTSKKNATDMAMVIDAMDLLYAGHVDSFALMSSDGDFTPLVMRLLTNGKRVYGYGEEKTPVAFVNACSQFTYVDRVPNFSSPSGPAPSKPWSRQALQADARLINLLRLTVGTCQDETGWSHLGNVGHHISNQASFDPRNYGFKKLSEVFEATGLFDVRRDSTLTVSVRPRT